MYMFKPDTVNLPRLFDAYLLLSEESISPHWRSYRALDLSSTHFSGFQHLHFFERGKTAHEGRRLFHRARYCAAAISYLPSSSLHDMGNQTSFSYYAERLLWGVPVWRILEKLSLSEHSAQAKFAAVFGRLLIGAFRKAAGSHEEHPEFLCHGSITGNSVYVSYDGEVIPINHGSRNVERALESASPHRARSLQLNLFSVGVLMLELLQGRTFLSHFELSDQLGIVSRYTAMIRRLIEEKAPQALADIIWKTLHGTYSSYTDCARDLARYAGIWSKSSCQGYLREFILYNFSDHLASEIRELLDVSGRRDIPGDRLRAQVVQMIFCANRSGFLPYTRPS